tara:strand:- start:740 stop:1798 length:1059 start_codon:yes stop_codon:yes gene_type:complete
MINNLNIASITKISTPKMIIDEIPNNYKEFIINSRQTISNILNKKDKKLLVILGPCSIHDTESALHYARELSKMSKSFKENLFIVMRCYFEKPRTTIGWKGLIYDPFLDNSNKIEDGIRIARQLLRDITKLELPIGLEVLDTITPQYISDFISWGAIGARTCESQIHRQLISGMSMPIGIKNTTDGNIKNAVNAITSARHPHSFMGCQVDGNVAIVHTKGNDNTHIILRGGNGKPNYYPEIVTKIKSDYGSQKIMIDCSHCNSNKQSQNQLTVVESCCEQIISNDDIIGVMIESNIFEGKQKLTDKSILKYGVSITDSCIGLEETYSLLFKLNDAIKQKYKRTKLDIFKLEL